MGASKTANALMVAYNYEEKGLNPLVLKPKIENRDGEKIIKSRIGLSRQCELVEDMILPLNEKGNIDAQIQNQARILQGVDCVIIDECQFMKPEHVKMLMFVVNTLQIPVICYGLSTDFKQELFPASAELMKLADKVEEIKTICWCGDGAKCNARLDSKGDVVRTGDQIQMGGTEKDLPSYTSLCTKHYIEGNIGPRMRAKFQAFADLKKSEVVSDKEISISNIDYYTNAFLEMLKAAYVDKYENLYEVIDKYKEDVFFHRVDRKSWELEYFSEMNAIGLVPPSFKDRIEKLTIDEWHNNAYVQAFHDITYNILGIDDGTLAGEYEAFDVSTDVGYWLYYYENPVDALESMKESADLHTEHNQKVYSILSKLSKEYELEHDGEELE